MRTTDARLTVPVVARPDAYEQQLNWRGRLECWEKACCCPARPLFRVVLPASRTRAHPTDLLLCGHHYRASRPALVAAGASVYDAEGSLLGPYAE